VKFPKQYLAVSKEIFQFENFKIASIEYDQKDAIMEWRNAQIDILRQSELLTLQKQISYFEEVLRPLFEQKEPQQLIFSFYLKDLFIGYGGLVHIDWKNKHAEISFLLDPSEMSKYYAYFKAFLVLIENVAKDIKLKKIFTFGYNLDLSRFRPLIDSDYNLEARLKDHVKIKSDFYEVLIYAKTF
jgi:hypothetical protein